MGDRAKNAEVQHHPHRGRSDHPVNRGTLCPKGSALLDVVHAPTRLKYPRYRAPGTSEFKTVSWDFALDRIARLMKDDRDTNFIAKNAAGHHGQPLDQHRHAGGLCLVERDRLPDLEGRPFASAWWCSTTRRVSDTDRRWPVWPQHSVAAR